jgi:hypothetical protein
MFKAKYILHTDLTPIIFPETIGHVQMAQNMRWARADIVGAGFVQVRAGGYVCYGESISLRVKSRDDKDSEVLNRYVSGNYDW